MISPTEKALKAETAKLRKALVAITRRARANLKPGYKIDQMAGLAEDALAATEQVPA